MPKHSWSGASRITLFPFFNLFLIIFAGLALAVSYVWIGICICISILYTHIKYELKRNFNHFITFHLSSFLCAQWTSRIRSPPHHSKYTLCCWIECLFLSNSLECQHSSCEYAPLWLILTIIHNQYYCVFSIHHAILSILTILSDDRFQLVPLTVLFLVSISYFGERNNYNSLTIYKKMWQNIVHFEQVLSPNVGSRWKYGSGQANYNFKRTWILNN